MCWGVTLDLMLACPLLREHVSTGKVSVGINHEMSDFRNKKKKNLDLVLCRSTESGTFGGSKSGRQAARTFAELAPIYGIALTDHERGSKPEPPKIPSADQRGLSRARSMG